MNFRGAFLLLVGEISNVFRGSPHFLVFGKSVRNVQSHFIKMDEKTWVCCHEKCVFAEC